MLHVANDRTTRGEKKAFFPAYKICCPVKNIIVVKLYLFSTLLLVVTARIFFSAAPGVDVKGKYSSER